MASSALRPTSTIASGGWTNNGGGGATFDRIDDDPDTPDTADYVEDDLGAGANASFGLTDAPADLGVCTNVDVRVYGVQASSATSNPSWVCELRKSDETVLATVSFPEPTAQSLKNTSAAVSLSKADVNGLKLVLISTLDATIAPRRCFAAEVVLTYSPPGNRTLLGVG